MTNNASVAMAFLEPLGKHINDAGVGFISEIFDGNSPHHARGCIAQAWGVAQTLKAWKVIAQHLPQKEQENKLERFWKTHFHPTPH